MQEHFSLKESSRAMLAFTLRMGNQGTPQSLWNPKLRSMIVRKREAIRIAEQGGGMCHEVGAWLHLKYGWERLAVSYLDAQGRVICAGHYVNALPGGALLDATADQFAEGHDIRVLQPTDAEYGRYRPEFDDEINPRQYPEFADFYWDGVDDCESAQKVEDALGITWWCKDDAHKQRWLAFLQHQVDLGCEFYGNWITAIEQELSSTVGA